MCVPPKCGCDPGGGGMATAMFWYIIRTDLDPGVGEVARPGARLLKVHDAVVFGYVGFALSAGAH